MKRPSRIRKPSGLRTRETGGTKERELLGVPSGGKPVFGPGAATGESQGLRLRRSSGRTGLRPGSCEPGRTGAQVNGLPGGTFGFGRKDPAGSNAWLRPGGGKVGKEGFGSRSAKRRTARASALTGSPRGNRKEGFGLIKDPGDRYQNPRFESGFETARAGLPRLPGWVPPATGQWGPAATPAPITLRPSGGARRPAEPVRRGTLDPAPDAMDSPRTEGGTQTCSHAATRTPRPRRARRMARPAVAREVSGALYDPDQGTALAARIHMPRSQNTIVIR